MALGVHDVDGLLEGLTSEQFMTWVAYDRLEPIGAPWQMAATMTAAIINELRTMTMAQLGQPMREEDMISPADLLGQSAPPPPADPGADWATLCAMARGG